MSYLACIFLLVVINILIVHETINQHQFISTIGPNSCYNHVLICLTMFNKGY